MTTTTTTALVIGGGIAGPVAAMALHQAGIEASVYEAHDSTADGVGGGLSIAPNGLDALGAIGKPMFRVHTAGSVGGTTGVVGVSHIQARKHRRVLAVAF